MLRCELHPYIQSQSGPEVAFSGGGRELYYRKVLLGLSVNISALGLRYVPWRASVVIAPVRVRIMHVRGWMRRGEK